MRVYRAINPQIHMNYTDWCSGAYISLSAAVSDLHTTAQKFLKVLVKASYWFICNSTMPEAQWCL